MGGEPSISYRTFVPLRKLSFCLIASNVTLLVWKRFDNEPGEWTTGQHRKYNNDINNVARNYEAHWAFVSHRNKIFLFIVDPLPHFPFFFSFPSSHSILRVLQNIETREKERERNGRFQKQYRLMFLKLRGLFFWWKRRDLCFWCMFNYFSQIRYYYCCCYNLRV